MSNGLKVALLALACFATSISEFAIVGMIDVVAESAGVSVAMIPVVRAIVPHGRDAAPKPAEQTAPTAAVLEA